MDVGVEWIDRIHRQNGYFKIGYHYVICRDGHLEFGRSEEQTGAHAIPHNRNSIGICMVGGIDASGKSEDNFTDEQYLTLKHLLDYLLEHYPDARVAGHGKLPDIPVPKDCPCFDVPVWMKSNGFDEKNIYRS